MNEEEGAWVEEVVTGTEQSVPVVVYFFGWKSFRCPLRDLPSEHREAMVGESAELLRAYEED